MIIEVPGRIFHMFIEADTDEGPANIVADAALEPSMGLLMISVESIAVVGSWPCKKRWGTETFEEFLCLHKPSELVSKMLGRDALIFDADRTRDALAEICENKHLADVYEFVDHINDYGEVLPTGKSLETILDEHLKEPVTGFIFMQKTQFAEFLIDVVVPDLLERIATPCIVPDHTNQKLS